MQKFDSDGVEIAYSDTAGPGAAAGSEAGEPILLIHGFASNTKVNWANTSWIDTLQSAGYRVISMDNRGHGESEKLYDLDLYGGPIMAEDARRLLDHLGLKSANVMGYSMGARITAFLTIKHPDRVKSAVFGGLGYNMVRGMAGTGPIANALEAPNLEDVTNPTARTFRAFAEQTGSDLRALATCIRSSRDPITAEAVGTIKCPILVAVGETDVVGGSPMELAKLIPNGQALVITGKDHMKAVGDATYKEGVLKFLRNI